ncbi:MAG: serine hydrolase domain-containing protein, partial [Actinomycetes bacterium]
SEVAKHGVTTTQLRIASITKLLTAWATLVAAEEGAVALSDPAGQPGCTLELLLCHAGGYQFDSPTIVAAPGARRIYSNTGYELVAEHVTERTGIPFPTYLSEAVFEPLGMHQSELRGSPAADLWSTADDLVRFAAELLTPRLVDRTTALDAQRVHLPQLDGVLPGWGRFAPLPWGLGPELRGRKSPTWMGESAPPTCFGHFGGSGTLLWVDPEARVAAVALTDHEFGPWAVSAWPGWSDRVRAAYS